MSKNYAYIRISDSHKQDSETQKNSISNYASENGLIINEWIEEHVSGSKTDASSREISGLISRLDKSDKLICTEISRLGRNKPFSIIGLINEITEIRKAELHLTYSDQCITPDNVENAEVLFTTVAGSYVARQEAIKRSERARAAIRRRTDSGLSNGRPRGLLVKSKLDQYEDFIVRSLNDDVGQSQLARDLNCGRVTLIRWLKKRDDIRTLAESSGLDMRKPLSELKKLLN